MIGVELIPAEIVHTENAFPGVAEYYFWGLRTFVAGIVQDKYRGRDVTNYTFLASLIHVSIHKLAGVFSCLAAASGPHSAFLEQVRLEVKYPDCEWAVAMYRESDEEVPPLLPGKCTQSRLLPRPIWVKGPLQSANKSRNLDKETMPWVLHLSDEGTLQSLAALV